MVINRQQAIEYSRKIRPRPLHANVKQRVRYAPGAVDRAETTKHLQALDRNTLEFMQAVEEDRQMLLNHLDLLDQLDRTKRKYEEDLRKRSAALRKYRKYMIVDDEAEEEEEEEAEEDMDASGDDNA